MNSLFVRIILIICFNALVFPLAAQSDSVARKAYSYAMEGLDFVQKNRLDQAIESFEKGYAVDPSNSRFRYEIAVVHYIRKDYSRAIEELENVIGKPDVNEQYFQVLGNAYDLSGKTETARKTYLEGMKRFPSSGVLYLEAGILEYLQKNYPEARRFWEGGIIAQPAFSMNYYWLVKAYSVTPEKIWAALYGEIFINMDRNSEKTREVSQLLYDMYTSCIVADSNGTARVNFTKSLMEIPLSGVQLPFEQLFQNTMQWAADSVLRKGADSIGIAELCVIRSLFLYFWTEQKFDKVYPNILFDRHRELADSGWFESYNRWVFLKGSEQEFQAWYYAQPDLYMAFVSWFGKNPVKFSEKHYFSRSLF